MTEDPYLMESKDGLRASWMAWPVNKAIEQKNAVPVTLFYTPIKNIPTIGLVEYDPIICIKCKSVLNPFSAVDYIDKS